MARVGGGEREAEGTTAGPHGQGHTDAMETSRPKTWRPAVLTNELVARRPKQQAHHHDERVDEPTRIDKEKGVGKEGRVGMGWEGGGGNTCIQLRRQLPYATNSGGPQAPFVCLHCHSLLCTTHHCHADTMPRWPCDGGPQVPYICNTICCTEPLHRCHVTSMPCPCHTPIVTLHNPDPLARFARRE